MRDEKDLLIVESVEALREAAEALRTRFARKGAATVDRIADDIERKHRQCVAS